MVVPHERERKVVRDVWACGTLREKKARRRILSCSPSQGLVPGTTVAGAPRMPLTDYMVTGGGLVAQIRIQRVKGWQAVGPSDESKVYADVG